MPTVTKPLMQIVVDSFNLKMDSAQHREGWSGSVTDVLGVIKGKNGLLGKISQGSRLGVELHIHFLTLLCMWLYMLASNPRCHAQQPLYSVR